MSQKMKILMWMGIVGFAIWSFMAYIDASLRADYLKYVISIVIGVTGLALREMPTAQHPPDTPTP